MSELTSLPLIESCGSSCRIGQVIPSFSLLISLSPLQDLFCLALSLAPLSPHLVAASFASIARWSASCAAGVLKPLLSSNRLLLCEVGAHLISRY